MPRPPLPRPAWARLAAAAALGASLSACADRVVTAPTYPGDVRDRHPIVLADGPRRARFLSGEITLRRA